MLSRLVVLNIFLQCTEFKKKMYDVYLFSLCIEMLKLMFRKGKQKTQQFQKAGLHTFYFNFV